MSLPFEAVQSADASGIMGVPMKWLQPDQTTQTKAQRGPLLGEEGRGDPSPSLEPGKMLGRYFLVYASALHDSGT